ncbi:MAG: hypothetical protein WCW30_05075, partial [Candidatus Gracilibacteria bacterium]
FIFFKTSIRKQFSSLLLISFSLFLTSFFFCVFINSFICTRTLFLLYVALYIAISIGFYSLYCLFQTQYFKIIILSSISLYFIVVFFSMGSFFSGGIAPFPPVNHSEIQAFEWLQNNYDMSSVFIVSDFYTLETSSKHINSLNSNLLIESGSEEEKKIASMLQSSNFMQEIFDFLSSPFLTGDSLNFIQTIFNDFNPSELIIIISPRTRQALGLDYPNGVFFPSAILDTTTDFPPLKGENKFQNNNSYFDLIYDNGETQVYKYNAI